MPATVQTQALPPVPSATPVTGQEMITQYWGQWFIQLRDKVNTINATLAQFAGNTNQQSFDTLSPLTTTGDMLIYSGGHNIRLGIGTTGQILSVVAGVPAWVDPSAGSSPLTTKGDIYVYSTTNTRLPIGTDSYVLTADSTQATGMSWKPAGTPTLPLTTKGDILGYSTSAARIPVGTDGQVLVADSTQVLGVRWATSYTPPVTTKGDIFGYSTIPTRIPVGSNGQVLTADSTQAAGVAWSTITSGWGLVKKIADETRTSTTTLTNDSTLTISLSASTRYHIRGYILFSQTDGTMGNKFSTTYSGISASVYYTQSEIIAGAINNNTTYANNSNTYITDAAGGGGLGYVSYKIHIIINTTTSGTFSIQWAQNTSTANGLTLLAGSYLEYQTF